MNMPMCHTPLVIAENFNILVDSIELWAKNTTQEQKNSLCLVLVNVAGALMARAMPFGEVIGHGLGELSRLEIGFRKFVLERFCEREGAG